MNFLIVDDMMTNRLALKLSIDEFVEKNKIEVFEAENGQEAVDICKNNRIDLVFMDIMMPVMNGYEATKKIKELYHDNIYIIAITALDREEDIAEAMKSGVDSFLTKPFNKAKLLASIEIFMKLKKSNNANLTPAGTHSKNPYSNFEDNYKNVLTIFTIKNEDDVSTIWNVADGFYELDNKNELVDFLAIIYDIQAHIKHQFGIMMEMGDDDLYFTIDDKDVVDYLETKDLKSDSLLLNNKISFKLRLGHNNNEIIDNSSNDISNKQEDIKEHINLICKEETKFILSELNSSIKRISAKEYFEKNPVPQEVIDIFGALEARLEDLFYDKDKISQDELDLLVDIYDEYVVSLNKLYSFTNLAYVLQTLSSILKSVNIFSMDDETKEFMFEFVYTVSKDLTKWSEIVLLNGDVQDIHYLESSLMSSILYFESFIEDFTFSENDDDFEIF